MKPVLTADEMRWCDDVTINTYGIAGLQLMENAGRGVAEIIKQEVKNLSSKHVLVVCGKGNNGGDGFVVARWLLSEGCKITVLLLALPAEIKDDAKKNFDALRKISSRAPDFIQIIKYKRWVLKKLDKPDVVVDAIFGTGFSGSVREPYMGVIEWINKLEAKVFSVDIPSGVNGSNGVVENYAVKANYTVTFGALKPGLLCNKGRECAGIVKIVDICIPKFVLEDKKHKSFLVESHDVKKVLPRRSVHAHKYSVGKIFVIAGSTGLTGAAAMCCLSAMKAGAGAVVLGTPEPVYQILAKKLTEVMVYPLPATDEGTLSLKAFDVMSDKLDWADVLVVGPGLSQNQETQNLVMKILMSTNKKVLIDADGLNALSSFGASKLRSMRASFILTPHVGEFSRLSGLTSHEIEKNRINVSREFARKFNATIVLKGVPTATAVRDGCVYLNPTGNPGMATAGSGDVLSGVIAGLWAQGLGEAESAWAGAYLHGLAGDIGAQKVGQRSLVATDIIKFLPDAFKQIELGGG